MTSLLTPRSRRVLEWIKGPEVLDVGFVGQQVGWRSPWWLHRVIRERFPATWGLDSSASVVDELRREGFDNLIVADAQDFTLDRAFDTIVAGELIEHLGNPLGLLESSRRHLKEGGRVIVTTPYVFGLHHWLYAQSRFPKTCANETHAMWFCPSTLRRLASMAQFRVVHSELIAQYGTAQRPLVRVIYRLWNLTRGLLPARTRATTMLFVLEDAGT